MIEIETIIVQLGEQEFPIKTAGFVRSKPWKKRLLEEIQPLFEQISESQKMVFEGPADLLKLFPIMQTILLDLVDRLLDLLFMYAPELEAARDYIENNATDKQIVIAFQGVVKLADPFGVVDQMTRQFGRKAIGT